MQTKRHRSRTKPAAGCLPCGIPARRKKIMHRRHALTFMAFSALAPTLVLAQQRQAPQDGFAEKAGKYIRDTLQTGSLALATSRIAQEKASTPWVKRFANYERAEQEGLAQVLSPLVSQQPSEEDEERQRILQELNGLSGEKFEQSFMQGQAEGHQKLLHIQDDFIKGAQATVLASIAGLIRGRVEEHIDLIQAIRDQMHQTAKR
jgi:putative membrane protein